MKYTLVYLLSNPHFTFKTMSTDGVVEAHINKIEEQLYVPTENVNLFCESMVGHFDGYLIPSTYEDDDGEIIYNESIDDDFMPEFPDDYSWSVIEKHYPNYYSCDDILLSDLLKRYVDGELHAVDETSESDIEWIEGDCPSYLTKMQWAEHQSAELDTKLFQIAVKSRDKK